MTQSSGVPGPAGDRIEALDFVRGVALFGILLMNITGFGLSGAYNNPSVSGGADGANLWAWIVTSVGFEGTQRGLFSILFGAGVVLFTSRLEAAGRPDSADIYFRRNLWLIAFGLFNAFILLWVGDILYAYGITALFVFAFRKLAVRPLLILGVAGLLIGAAWNAKDNRDMLGAHAAAQPALAAKAAGTELSSPQTESIEAWEEEESRFTAKPEKVKEEVEAKTGGYWRAMKFVADENAFAQSWYMYRYFFDIFGMMLIGMALFKAGVLTLERPLRLYLLMVGLGYGIGLATNVIETRWIIENRFSALAYAQAEITYDLGRLAMTAGHLGTLLLFVRSGALPWLRQALAAVGRMALTSYLAHSVVCAIIFIGFGLYGQLERHQLYYVVFSIWAVQLAVSPIWLARYRFGPVEWLWRYLTYGTRPPMLRGTPTKAPLVPAE